MKLLFILIPLALTDLPSFAQNEEYVCIPCGNDCDKVVHTKSGNCPSCHMKLIKKKDFEFKNLTVEEFCNRIDANPDAVILDVRSESEFKGRGLRSTYGHFKNAININITDLKDRLSELNKFKEREVLVYCSHSVRSPQASLLLTENGFKNVANMAGGVSTIKSVRSDCLKKNYIEHK